MMRVDIRDLQFEQFNAGLARAVAHSTAVAVGLDIDRLTIVLVDDDRIRDLNNRFRGKDRPTDVISFEAGSEGDETAGEIVLSTDSARRQADAAGHSVDAETAWLIAHSVLHVAGMDDETEEDLEQMKRLQRRVVSGLGIEVKE